MALHVSFPSQVQKQLAWPECPDQFTFPFAWPSIVLADLSDKQMVRKYDKWGEVVVYRVMQQKIWVVSKWVPVIGPSGYVGSAVRHVFPNLFFTGREAHGFANSLNQYSGPLIDLTRQ